LLTILIPSLIGFIWDHRQHLLTFFFPLNSDREICLKPHFGLVLRTIISVFQSKPKMLPNVFLFRLLPPKTGSSFICKGLKLIAKHSLKFGHNYICLSSINLKLLFGYFLFLISVTIQFNCGDNYKKKEPITYNLILYNCECLYYICIIRILFIYFCIIYFY